MWTASRKTRFIRHLTVGLVFQAGLVQLCQQSTGFPEVLLKYRMEYNKTHGDVVISTLQVQVDDVKNVMSENIEKVLNREERLSELADRSGDLETAAHGFQKTTAKVSRKMWWKNTKLIIIIAIVILTLVVFIILLATGVIPS